MRGRVVAFGLVAGFAAVGWGQLPPATAAGEITLAAYDPADEWQGLPEGDGREPVYFNCIACHSTAIIQQQGMTEGYWKITLERMVDEMGMPELAEDEYDLVLDYLVSNFGPNASR
jgi:hypothetical protein